MARAAVAGMVVARGECLPLAGALPLLPVAMAAVLLPAERVELHERTAQALCGTGDQALAAEAAGHWQAAVRPAEELPARGAAAEAAERVFGYAHCGPA